MTAGERTDDEARARDDDGPGERDAPARIPVPASASAPAPAPAKREYTRIERWIDERAHRILDARPSSRARAALVEFLVFGAKQAWACVFGALMLLAVVGVRALYPDGLALASNDLLTLIAVAIQVVMIVTRLETGRELVVILLFHIAGTGMEIFKTDAGSWSYDEGGVLRIGGVPLFSGFMYAAVGSYMVRVMRLFDLRFTRYPPVWLTTVVALAIYANFFTHHFIIDLRWVLLAAVTVLWGRTVMHFHVFRTNRRMPQLLAFLLVACVIWIAENIGTLAGAWLYPNQLEGWQLVSPEKVVSWFLLMILSVVMVTWISPPRAPDAAAAAAGRTADAGPSGPPIGR